MTWLGWALLVLGSLGLTFGGYLLLDARTMLKGGKDRAEGLTGALIVFVLTAWALIGGLVILL
jgi:hypothetical protein